MGLFYKRPLCVACLLFLFSAFAGEALVPYVSWWGIAATVGVSGLLAGACYFFLRRRTPKAYIAFLLLLFGMLGLCRSYAAFSRANELPFGEGVSVQVRILEKGYARADRADYIVRILQINGESASGKALLRCAYNDDFLLGSELELLAVAEDIQTASDLSHVNAYLADGVSCLLLSEDSGEYMVASYLSHDPILRLRSWNRALSNVLRCGETGDAENLASAMLLGNRHLLSDTVLRDFRRAGISHVLALSGLHVSILVAALELVLRKLPMHRGVRIALLAAAALFFLALTGFGASTMRATFMLLIVYLSRLWGVRGDTLTSLMTAVCLIVLLSPAALFDIGLLMSFLAVFGMIVGGELLRARRTKKKGGPRGRVRALLGRCLRYVGTVLWNTAMCLLAMIGVSCFVFGELSLMAFAANLLILPLTTLFLVLALLSLLASPIPPLFAALIGLVRGIASLMLEIAATLSSSRGMIVSLTYGFARLLVVLFCVSMSVLLLIKLRHKWPIALLPILFTAVFAVCLSVWRAEQGETMTVYYLRQKSNETFFVSEGEQFYLVDATSGAHANFYQTGELLRAAHATELEACVLTHYHARHADSLDSLFASHMVRELWVPDPLSEKDAAFLLEMYEVAERHGVRVRLYAYETELSLGAGHLWVSAAYLERSTHPTLVLQIANGEEALTYLGSSVEERETLETVTERVAESPHLILGAHGPVRKLPWRVPGMREELSSLFLAEMPFIDPADERLVSALRRAPVRWGGEYQKYVWE